ncbi:hypothetical protein [Sphaerisporangium fuscum]|uniref:hypothetical protein n=1 Tax=Sphaerisporangium fuscum TaxID=2835868 RepID=UPI001BDC6A97|nr:hypothetical protein [Sphaerisporangium fuscum]
MNEADLDLGDTSRLTLELWKADAVVLFDWLMRVELDELPTQHAAESKPLWISRLGSKKALSLQLLSRSSVHAT